MPETPPADRFPTTRWSRVVSAGDRDAPASAEALAELCRGYWYPIYAFIRRKGHPPDEAADRTQEYFVRLLERGVLGAADPDKGRFRAFLRADCGHFLADRCDHDRALKRGGGISPVTIDARDAEGRYLVEPADATTPDRLFDRAWALTLLGRTLDVLGRAYADSGRADLFDRLKVVLTDGPRAARHADLADGLGMTEAAVEGAVRRLRGRYRETLRDEIAATLRDPSPADLDDEIRDLFAALGV